MKKKENNHKYCFWCAKEQELSFAACGSNSELHLPTAMVSSQPLGE
jgi:hypothetical protein